MADKTIVVRAVYRSNVAQGVRGDAGAITSLSAAMESSAGKVVSRTKALGAASALAGKLLIVGIGGAMAVSAKAAIDFESSMAGVAKTTDLAGNSFDRNSGPLFQFGEALRTLSLRTPINVNELASIAALGGQLGIATPNLIEFTEVMAALAVSTNLTAEEAATGFARFANIMRTPQDEFERLGSIVVELGNNMATTESEILHFGTRIAPIGRTVGATEEEIFAMSAALTSLGVPAERGGTAIQKWMIMAKQAVDSGSESLESFADVAGMTTEAFSALFTESPGRAFEAFVRGLDQINQSGGDVFSTLKGLQMSEVRTTQVLLAAASGVETLAEAFDLAEAEGQEVNALFQEAARRYGTTESAIAMVANAFNDLRIEIGNMILGSGGLAFSLDMLTEFFRIIKDNLPFLKGFVSVIGLLLAMKAGLWFAEIAQKAVLSAKALYGASQAAVGMSSASRAMQGGLLLVTAGMQAALGIAGALAAIWLIQASNAAALRAKVKGLRDEIEQGADAFEVLSGSVEESLSDIAIKQIHNAGLTVAELTQLILDGATASRDLSGAFTDARLEGIRFGDIKPAIQEIEGFINVVSDDLVNSFIESGNASQISAERLREFARQAMEIFGLDVTADQFVGWVNAITSATQGQRKGRGGIRQEVEGIKAAVEDTPNWTEFLPPDDAESMVEDFFEGNIEAVDTFVEEMDEAFAQVGEIVRGGMPAWEDYQQAVLGAVDEQGNTITLGIQDALAAQDRFLEDTRSWIERMPDIMEMGASSDTVGWIESLEPPIRGAIGRLNDAQLEELIAGANANFDELNALHNLRWLQVYGDNANLAFGAMVGELATRVQEMNLPGEQAGEAFAEGIDDIMSTLPEEHKDAFLGYIKEALTDESWLEANGFDSLEPWIVGILKKLATLSARVLPTVSEQSREIQNAVRGYWGVNSPSKWWENLGEQFTLGLERGAGGMFGVLNQFNPSSMPVMNAGSGAMSSITNTRTNNYALTVNGGGRSNNLNAESQTLLTLLTIVGGVEAGAGR